MSRPIIIFMSILVYTVCNTYAEDSKDEKSDDITEEEYINTIVSEMRSVFHQKPDFNKLPKYGILPITTINKGSSDNEPFIQVRTTNPNTHKHYDLNLIPIKHNVFSNKIPKTVVWAVTSSSDQTPKYTYNIVDIGGNRVPIHGNFYEDAKHMAVLLVNVGDDGNAYYDGAIGESLNKTIVRPVPEKWKRLFFSSSGHVMYKRDINSNTGGVRKTRIKRAQQSSTALYPKLLIAVDYNMFELLGSDIAETIRYVLTFWNAVNLKYREFTNPEIKIMVTGIIISKDETAMHYVYSAVNQQEKSKIDKYLLLNLARAYFANQFINETGFTNYDATIIMTPLKGGSGVVGLAYQSHICNRKYGVGYVSDDGNFNSVDIASHELGHLLGVPHDENNCYSTPKRTNSNAKFRSIMNKYHGAAHEYVWSNCSKAFISKLATQKYANCLKSSIRTN